MVVNPLGFMDSHWVHLTHLTIFAGFPLWEGYGWIIIKRDPVTMAHLHQSGLGETYEFLGFSTNTADGGNCTTWSGCDGVYSEDTNTLRQVGK